MFFVISGIIAIALFATFMAYGAGHITTDALVRRDVYHTVQGAAGSLATGFQAYRVANNGARPTQASWTSEIADYLPGRSFEAAAKTPKGMTWSYATSPSKSWLCLSGESVSKGVLEGMVLTSKAASGGSMRISEECPLDGASRAEGESSCVSEDVICSTMAPARRAIVVYLQG